ncbi:MAG: CcmD family protein [Gemmatimonadota bacterium]|nr:CcmD family protein [Gemmatimonadota bacterium]
MQHLGYMAAAYAVIWAAILIYFLGLGRREREIWMELQKLRESIRERDAEADSGDRQ